MFYLIFIYLCFFKFTNDYCFMIFWIYPLVYIFQYSVPLYMKESRLNNFPFNHFVLEYQLRYQISFTLSWWIGKLFHRHHRTNHKNPLVSAFHVSGSVFFHPLCLYSEIVRNSSWHHSISYSQHVPLFWHLSKTLSLYICKYMQVFRAEDQFAINKEEQLICTLIAICAWV